MKPIGYNKRRMRRDYAKIRANVREHGSRLRLFSGNFSFFLFSLLFFFPVDGYASPCVTSRANFIDTVKRTRACWREQTSERTRADMPQLIKENDARPRAHVALKNFTAVSTANHGLVSRISIGVMRRFPPEA